MKQQIDLWHSLRTQAMLTRVYLDGASPYTLLVFWGQTVDIDWYSQMVFLRREVKCRRQCDRTGRIPACPLPRQQNLHHTFRTPIVPSRLSDSCPSSSGNTSDKAFSLAALVNFCCVSNSFCAVLLIKRISANAFCIS